MQREEPALSPFEHFLGLFTKMRHGEGRAVLLFAAQSFLMLFSYYIIKTVREAFILTDADAEGRAYTVALVAAVLMVVVPLYSALRRRVDGPRLVRTVTWVFVAVTILFAFLAYAQVRIGVIFFIWGSLFGTVLVANFWAFAADTFNLKSGQRLFPVILMAANLGALLGASAASAIVRTVSPIGLVLLAAVTLAATLPFVAPSRRAVPEGSRAEAREREPHADGLQRLIGGFAVVFADRYLRALALFVVVLNVVNTTGEFIIADVVEKWATEEVASSPMPLDKGTLIAEFYGNYQFWFTLVGLLIQALLVSRIFRIMGVRGALLIGPIVAAFAYGAVAFLPIFALIRVAKIIENAIDYSLVQTTRHALYLPTSRSAKYEGKMTIDAFFWRFGDLLQGAIVFAGINLFGMGTVQFALFVFALALGWLAIAWWVGRLYTEQAKINVINAAPEARKAIPDVRWEPGRPILHRFDDDVFVDTDPGDVLTLRARQRGAQGLPAWLSFDPRRREFSGTPPPAVQFDELHVEVIASDVDGFEASTSFRILRVQMLQAS